MSSARVPDPIPVAGTTANLTASGTITRPIRTVSSPSPSSSRRLLVRGVFVLAERGVQSDEVLDEGEGDEVEEIADMIDCDTSAKRTDARFWLLESLLHGQGIVCHRVKPHCTKASNGRTFLRLGPH